ncbi:hypothetical protein D3C85_693250 [compost metagenome]
MSEWVSVKDSLPVEVDWYWRESSDVLVVNSFGFESKAFLVVDNDSHRWFDSEERLKEIYAVTHWRYI